VVVAVQAGTRRGGDSRFAEATLKEHRVRASRPYSSPGVGHAAKKLDSCRTSPWRNSSILFAQAHGRRSAENGPRRSVIGRYKISQAFSTRRGRPRHWCKKNVFMGKGYAGPDAWRCPADAVRQRPLPSAMARSSVTVRKLFVLRLLL